MSLPSTPQLSASAASGAASGVDAGVTVTRNASLLAAATIVARLSALVLGVVMARELGPAVYGRYGFALALGTILVPVADVGVTQYLSREAARAPLAARALAVRLAAVKAALSVGVLAGTSALALLLSDDRQLVAAVLAVLTWLLADGISAFVYGYFQGRQRMAYEATLTAGAAIARGLGGALVVLMTGELLPALVAIVLVSLAAMAHAGTRLRSELRRTAHERGTSAPPVDWRAVAAMGMFMLFVLVYLRADAVLIGLLAGERAVGLYTAAYTFTLGLGIVPWMIALALTPVFADSHGRDRALFADSWHEGVRAVVLASAPLALVAGLCATPIVERLFGEQFGPAAVALAVLVWSAPLVALNVVVTGVLRGAGRERWLTGCAGAGALLNVGLNLWAIPALGIAGAATVTVATEAFVLGVLGALCMRRAIVPWPRLPLARIALALSALAGVALAAAGLPVELRALLALCAYSATLVASGVVTRRDLALVRAAVAQRDS